MIRPALAVLSPPGARGRLSILIFHRVVQQRDPLLPDLPDAQWFDGCMRWVSAWCNVLPLNEAVRRLAAGTLPARSLSITFDDGYADNVTVAAPILRRYGLHATFFVATGFLEGGAMWNDRVIEAIRRSPIQEIDLSKIGLGSVGVANDTDRRAAIERVLEAIKHRRPADREAAVQTIEEACASHFDGELMMRSGQVVELAKLGMDIGAHTVTHPILARLPVEQARWEIAESKSALESIIGRRVELFAYPNGLPGRDFAPEHVELVRTCGFKAAVTTAWGSAGKGDDIYQLPRFTPWNRSRLGFGLRLLSNARRAAASMV